FVARAKRYYERVWGLFAPRGHARLAFAVHDGRRVATLFHFTCGDRAAETFGGMTDEGADSRANYLLKWQAILGFKADGFAVYDMWGLATGGIAQFKEGFGGREVEYVGARDLPLRPAEDAAMRLLLPAYGIAQRTRLRLMGRRLAGSDD
ncbi:MAG TPA: GNAT family N-acetyltransferase, partial [Candidatus Limnocylindria bacterium]|nr:GNAT family N-acetyltransferase [Candidatus Limnocylindria bacterium]